MFNTALNNNAPEKTGTVKAWGGSTAPSGWLFCDGSQISRTTYAALFAVIGTTYGSGDGTTTFNLPNFGGFAANIPVTGNGKTLGLTDGTSNWGLICTSNTAGWEIFNKTALGKNYGTANSGSNGPNSSKSVGVITTTTNSGLVAKTASASTQAKAIIKY